MFQKVLIAEDHETINYSLQMTLTALGVPHDARNYVYYCDDAIKRLQKAQSEGQPYQLLITDLSFEDDDPSQEITDGAALIRVAKAIQPDLRVLVFSIENRLSVALSLVDSLQIDGYVPKARRDAHDLQMAIEAIYQNKTHISANLKKESTDNPYQFTPFDIAIVSLLSQGKPQKEIPFYLQQNNITPSGLSSVEKRLSAIKTAINVFTNEQLIAYCKDKKII